MLRSLPGSENHGQIALGRGVSGVLRPFGGSWRQSDHGGAEDANAMRAFAPDRDCGDGESVRERELRWRTWRSGLFSCWRARLVPKIGAKPPLRLRSRGCDSCDWGAPGWNQRPVTPTPRSPSAGHRPRSRRTRPSASGTCRRGGTCGTADRARSRAHTLRGTRSVES